MHFFLKSKQSIHSVHNIHRFNGMLMKLIQLNYSVGSNTKYSNYMKL